MNVLLDLFLVLLCLLKVLVGLVRLLFLSLNIFLMVVFHLLLLGGRAYGTVRTVPASVRAVVVTCPCRIRRVSFIGTTVLTSLPSIAFPDSRTERIG